VPGDTAQDVDRNAGVGHPSQSGVAQAMTAQVVISAAGSGEQASIGAAVGGGDSALDEFVHFRDERYDAGALAFGGFVCEPAG
jgi:hypothetical protein